MRSFPRALHVSVAAVIACAVFVPTAAAQASVGQTDRAAAAPATQLRPQSKVQIIKSLLDLTKTVWRSIEQHQNRGGFVKGLMESSFYDAGQRYNVMVQCEDQPFDAGRLNGVVFEARIEHLNKTFHVWVFTDGEYWNKGDGGWINWAFRGWFDRDGGHVRFHRPPGAQAQRVASAKTLAEKNPVRVQVSGDQLGVGGELKRRLEALSGKERGDMAKEAAPIAFDVAGKRYNVMLFNLNQNYTDRLHGVKLFARVDWDSTIHYGLWIFDDGEFTNGGDGGWINWSFHGWFDRDGGHVKFRRP